MARNAAERSGYGSRSAGVELVEPLLSSHLIFIHYIGKALGEKSVLNWIVQAQANMSEFARAKRQGLELSCLLTVSYTFISWPRPRSTRLHSDSLEFLNSKPQLPTAAPASVGNVSDAMLDLN